MPVGVSGHSHIAPVIIGVGRGVAQRIRDLCDLVLGIALTGCSVSQPVALAGIEAIAVYGVVLHVALGVRHFYELTRIGILIGSGVALGIYLGEQAALSVIFHSGLIAAGIPY